MRRQNWLCASQRPVLMSTKRRTSARVLLVLTAAAMGFGLLSCWPGGSSEAPEPVTIGMESTAVNSLIYIAEEENYFAANGLEVTIKDDYPSGAAAADGLLKGEVDLATAAEFVIVRQALSRERVQILASIDLFMHMKLLVRKDLGIHGIPDLDGKTIGVPKGTEADFMLGRFLDLNGVDESRITLVDVQAPQAVDALTNRDVDAVVTWQPNVIAIQDRLGDRVSVWDVQSGQPIYCVLVNANDWARSHPDLVERALRSLVQAEDYVLQHRDRAEALIEHRLGYDDRYIEAIWPEHQLFVSLDQSLITAMEDQARWMIANDLTAEKEVPDFSDYVYEDDLQAIRPEAVNIIR
jgi:NitT/TauT family transport system substrate-binding protein